MASIPHLVPFYAGVLGLLLVTLSWRIMRMRRKLDVMLGDGGQRDLNVAVRMQGNFVEYVPMALFLLYLDEAAGWNAAIIHALCLTLVLARLAHVHGMSRRDQDGLGRRLGARATFAVIIAASLLCVAADLGLAR